MIDLSKNISKYRVQLFYGVVIYGVLVDYTTRRYVDIKLRDPVTIINVISQQIELLIYQETRNLVGYKPNVI